jgi:spore germination protein GerM
VTVAFFSIFPYYNFVAVRKNNKKESSRGHQAMVVFWLVFVIVIISVFMLNAETIQRNFNVFRTRLTAPSGIEEGIFIMDEEQIEVVIEPQTSQNRTEPASQNRTEPAPQPQAPEPAPPVVSVPSTQQPTRQQTPPQSSPAPAVQTRDRVIYFTQVSSDGQILQTRVTRRIPVSQSPMQDSLNVLLAGPSAEELNRGILNLIPQNTRILSTTIRGNTAYISFSEDFLFNTFGVEGYVAQLRQIVWTVTEFSNVTDVQILIEGRRMDYLGEGIWIGSPINRQSF